MPKFQQEYLLQTQPAGERIRTYHFGKSTIHVVAPDITDFERKRRLEEVYNVIRQHVSVSLFNKR